MLDIKKVLARLLQAEPKEERLSTTAHLYRAGSFYGWGCKLWSNYDGYAKSFRMACSKRRCRHRSDNSSNNKNNSKRHYSVRGHGHYSKWYVLTYLLLCEKRRHIHNFNIQGNTRQCNIILIASGRRWAAC